MDTHTLWQRLKGRSFRQLLLGFGECVLYKLPVKGPNSAPDGNMGSRWLEGVLLGYNRTSNTNIVATDQETRRESLELRESRAHRGHAVVYQREAGCRSGVCRQQG